LKGLNPGNAATDEDAGKQGDAPKVRDLLPEGSSDLKV
jgi:hypothetical protein